METAPDASSTSIVLATGPPVMPKCWIKLWKSSGEMASAGGLWSSGNMAPWSSTSGLQSILPTCCTNSWTDSASVEHNFSQNCRGMMFQTSPCLGVARMSWSHFRRRSAKVKAASSSGMGSSGGVSNSSSMLEIGLSKQYYSIFKLPDAMLDLLR